MTSFQSNKLAMYRAVQAFLTAFLNSTTATAAFPALAAKFATLKTLITNILGLFATQATPLKGKIGVREQALAEATELALGVAGYVLSYARTERLPDLAAQVDLVRNDFERMRRAERMQLAQRVHDAALPIVAALADYGLTAAMLTELQTMINDTDGTVSATRSTADEKKVATGGLTTAFDAVDALLAEIDPLMVPLRKSDPKSYALYRAARRVFDRPGTRASADATPPPPASPTPAPSAPVPATPPVDNKPAA